MGRTVAAEAGCLLDGDFLPVMFFDIAQQLLHPIPGSAGLFSFFPKLMAGDIVEKLKQKGFDGQLIAVRPLFAYCIELFDMAGKERAFWGSGRKVNGTGNGFRHDRV